MGYRRASRRNGTHELQPAFTLVELLVVISIIAMLMSILLPALGRARESGRRVVCLSNLRQLTFAWNMYATENNDKLCSPIADWPDPGNQPWADTWFLPDQYDLPVAGYELGIKQGALWPYTQSIKLYKCQSTRGYRSIHSFSRLRDYSMSAVMGHPDLGPQGPPPVPPFKSLSSISRPSERMVFIDADGAYSLELPSRLHGYLLFGFWPLSCDSTTWEFIRNTPSPIAMNISTARHSNGCNLSFADGHCEYWRYKDKRTVKLAVEATDRDFEIAASSNNPDLDYMIKLLKGP